MYHPFKVTSKKLSLDEDLADLQLKSLKTVKKRNANFFTKLKIRHLSNFPLPYPWGD